MKEQLITFETAKLAKKKGCSLRKCACGKLPKCTCTESTLSQSLLQRWLREKHNIHIEIMALFPLSETWDVTVFLYKDDISNIEVGVYKTYEEALEFGLRGAIKLIKNK